MFQFVKMKARLSILIINIFEFSFVKHLTKMRENHSSIGVSSNSRFWDLIPETFMSIEKTTLSFSRPKAV